MPVEGEGDLSHILLSGTRWCGKLAPASSALQAKRTEYRVRTFWPFSNPIAPFIWLFHQTENAATFK